MRVFLDNLALTPSKLTLAAALGEGVARAEQAGRIVVEAIADGRHLDQADLEQPSETPGEFEEVRLITADPRDLVAEVLVSAAEALDQARIEQEQAAELVMAGRMGDAIGPLNASLTIWQQVREAVDRGSAILHTDAATFAVRGNRTVSMEVQSRTLAHQLSEVRSALSRQDWSSLADVLAYDLVEQTRSWQVLLHGMVEAWTGGHVSGSGGPGASGGMGTGGDS